MLTPLRHLDPRDGRQPVTLVGYLCPDLRSFFVTAHACQGPRSIDGGSLG